MKKHFLLVIFILLPFAAVINAGAMDLTGNIGISLYGGANIPTNGDYQNEVKSTDLLNAGAQFGLGISYYFTQGLGAEISCNYGFNSYQDKFKINGKEPVLSDLSVSLNGIYNFGHLLNNSMISPIARAGVGMYNWNHLDDGIGGDALKIGNEDFSATSFGFNFGLGADFNVIPNFTLGLIVDYNMFFPEDKDKFGENYAEQGFLTTQLKISYYLPTKSN